APGEAMRRAGQVAATLLEARTVPGRFAALRALVRSARALGADEKAHFIVLAERYGMEDIGRRLTGKSGNGAMSEGRGTTEAAASNAPGPGPLSADPDAHRAALAAPVKTAAVPRGDMDTISDQAAPSVREGAQRLTTLIERIDGVRKRLTPVGEGEPAAELAWRTNARGRFTETPGLITPARFDRLDLLAFDEESRVLSKIAGHQPLTSERFRLDGEVLTLSGVPVFAPRTGMFLGYSGRVSVERQFEALGLSASEVAEAAHEILTPLNAILGYAQMIEREVLGPAPGQLRRDAESIIKDAEQLLSVVSALGDAAALQPDGDAPVRAELVPAARLIRTLQEEVAEAAAARGLAVNFEDSGAASFRGDGDALQRALRRLVSAMIPVLRPGEALSVREEAAGIRIARPPSMTGRSAASLIAGPGMASAQTSPKHLGLSFALRLMRQLLDRSGGELCIEPDSFLLRAAARSTAARREAS
ncbi:MAG TPA: HAMP domain-containing sensor histidine kinase, partial [Paracoccaceae bacterium]|nr:HAMP domain-containing sensor histidine kinase [Paracoccaceae bacterium]